MARTVAELPGGTRITDYISLGVVAKTFSGNCGCIRSQPHRQNEHTSEGSASARGCLLCYRFDLVHAVVVP